MPASPIQQQDLGEVGQFLHDHLAKRISPQAWIASLTQRWAASQPNFGMLLRHEGRVVGVICAIYSDQIVDGQVLRFCNPHSWMVLEEHRSSSIGLVLQLLRQRDYHFTMFTPNPKVAQVFMGLRFRVLADSLLYFPNLPMLAPRRLGGLALSDTGLIGNVLEGPARQDFEAHRHLTWLNFVAFGRPGDVCLAIFKRTRWKKMACASLLHISDAGALERQGRLLGHHLLMSHGIPVCRIEGRLLAKVPPLAYRSVRSQPKLVASPTLRDDQVRDLYSELVALDI